MLKKLIAIKNVGRFKNCRADGVPEFAKNTLIFGANGYGKTTLCAIFRSLQSGDSAHVVGRRTLGATTPTTIDIRLTCGNTRFDGTAWGTLVPHLAVFDGTFIRENVHAGEVVDLSHKRNLYRVIIGRQGVALAAEDTRLAEESRAKTGQITTARRVIEQHVPAGMSADAFCGLANDPDIETKISEQERRVGAIQQAQQIAAREPLSTPELAAFPETFEALLGRTLDDVAADAEQRLADHVANHGMQARGVAWLAEGLAHVDAATCPFCGQALDGIELIANYRAVFGERYRALKTAIGAMRATVEDSVGETALEQLTRSQERNRAGAEFWRQYCEFDPHDLEPPATLRAAVISLRVAALALLERKANAPLEELAPDVEFTAAAGAYQAALEELANTNLRINDVNALVTTKKAQMHGASLTEAQRHLAVLTATQRRHQPAIARECGEFLRLLAEREAIDTVRPAVRVQLEAHSRGVMKPYETKINDYLDVFNAGFRIGQTTYAFPGGAAATTTYQLVINDTNVDVGDAGTPANRPSFKNTLSGGDRSTLALAFFLAHLHTDSDRGQKLVVFDDPFQSQDAFRRRQTVHEIKRVGSECAQVIVLSHDATFLKQVWEKAPAAERVAVQIFDARSQGSKIIAIDLNAACRGRMATEIDDLQAFHTTGAGEPLDQVKKMRVVLETHCRTTYPASFDGNDWLGDMVRKIRDGGPTHSAHDLYDELDRINDYTAQYHHGEDVADLTPDQIDARELDGFVRRTLRIVNALQA